MFSLLTGESPRGAPKADLILISCGGLSSARTQLKPAVQTSCLLSVLELSSLIGLQTGRLRSRL